MSLLIDCRTILCYHILKSSLLFVFFFLTIWSKLIPIFLKYRFSLLIHGLLFSFLIFLSTSFTNSFFPFHILCASIILALMFLVLINDAPTSPLIAAIGVPFLAPNIVPYTLFSIACNLFVSSPLKFIRPIPWSTDGIISPFQYVFPINILLQLLFITEYVLLAAFPALSIKYIFWLLRISLSLSIFSPKYLICSTT